MSADLSVAPTVTLCGGCGVTADDCYVLRDDCCARCTHYPEPVDDDVDEIAVERAVGGDKSITLTRDEHREAFARLDRRGLDNAAIGRLLGVSTDLVLRWRRGDCRPNHRPAIQERAMNVMSTTESATDALLRRAAQSESARIRRAAERVTEALDRLRAEFAADESKREARERVARLERELQDAKAALRGGAAPAQSSPDVDVKAVRAWAKANGHEVAPIGRVPRSIVEDYQRAHQAAS